MHCDIPYTGAIVAYMSFPLHLVLSDFRWHAPCESDCRWHAPCTIITMYALCWLNSFFCLSRCRVSTFCIAAILHCAWSHCIHYLQPHDDGICHWARGARQSTACQDARLNSWGRDSRRPADRYGSSSASPDVMEQRSGSAAIAAPPTGKLDDGGQTTCSRTTTEGSRRCAACSW